MCIDIHLYKKEEDATFPYYLNFISARIFFSRLMVDHTQGAQRLLSL